MQNNIENPEKCSNAEVALEKLEKTDLLSVNEERCADMILNSPKEKLVEVCKAENEICAEGFSSKGIDFYAILDTIKDPVGYKTS